MRGRKRRPAAQAPDEEGGAASAAPASAKQRKTTKEIMRTVKLSLSSVLVKSDGTADILQDLLLYCNQIRVLATLIVKHHLFTILEEDGVSALPFTPDQQYYARAFTCAQGKDLKTECIYKTSLMQSAHHVARLFPTPAYNGNVSGTAINQVFMYYAKQLSENLSTHLSTHHGDALQVWLQNEIRGEVLTDNPGEDGRVIKEAIRARKNAIKNDDLDSLGLTFDWLEYEISALADEENTGIKTRKLIPVLYALQRSAGQLEDRHKTPFKLFSVIPEGHIAISPITIDRRVMLHLYNAVHHQQRINKNGKPSKIKAPVMVREDEMDSTNWAALFHVDKINKLRGDEWQFAHTVMTDGVAVWVHLTKDIPKTENLTAEEYATRQIDLTVPGLYCDQNSINPVQLARANLVGLDPGVSAVITATRVADVDPVTLKLKDGCAPLVLRQRQYAEESMLRYNLKKNGVLKCKANKKRGRKKHNGRTKRWVRRKRNQRVRKSYAAKVPLAAATATLQAAPSPRRVEIAKFNEYLVALASAWADLWAFHGSVKRRKQKFFVYRRREAFMTRVVNSFEKHFGPNPVILFGNGADNGLFGRLKGGGVKGPVKELKRRLAKRYCVIGCSEFRSSKLCVHCGRELHVHRHGVVYCSQQSHHAMLNRDVTAAIKIAAIFLAKKMSIPLGPWAFGSKIDEVGPSDALASAIIGHAAQS